MKPIVQPFKHVTQKTYIDYLNEVRVAHACNQPLQTNKPVVDIGYESGYNTVAHFHWQFLRFKKTTPLQYRKLFSTSHSIAMAKRVQPCDECSTFPFRNTG